MSGRGTSSSAGRGSSSGAKGGSRSQPAASKIQLGEKPVKIQFRDESAYGNAASLTFKKWSKGDITRVYVSDYKNRPLGYIQNGQTNFTSRQGLSQSEVDTAVSKFENTYKY